MAYTEEQLERIEKSLGVYNKVYVYKNKFSYIVCIRNRAPKRSANIVGLALICLKEYENYPGDWYFANDVPLKLSNDSDLTTLTDEEWENFVLNAKLRILLDMKDRDAAEELIREYDF
jgi:hypothetical protein